MSAVGKMILFPSWNNGILINSFSVHGQNLEFQEGGSTFSTERRGVWIIFKLYKPFGEGKISVT